MVLGADGWVPPSASSAPPALRRSTPPPGRWAAPKRSRTVLQAQAEATAERETPATGAAAIAAAAAAGGTSGLEHEVAELREMLAAQQSQQEETLRLLRQQQATIQALESRLTGPPTSDSSRYAGGTAAGAGATAPPSTSVEVDAEGSPESFLEPSPMLRPMQAYYGDPNKRCCCPAGGGVLVAPCLLRTVAPICTCGSRLKHTAPARE